MTRHINIDDMDVEIWWNDYDCPEDTPAEDVPMCVTIYKNRNYLDYSTLALTKEEEAQMGIVPEIREGFTEWMTPTYFLTTQNVSARVRAWTEQVIRSFINE